MTITPRQLFRRATLQIVCMSACLLTLNSCARQFSVSVNQNVLYDPRPASGLIRVADPGLQSCINVTVRQREISDITDITVLACPQLEISSLAGLEAVASLRFIDLAGNELETLDGLRRLERLTSVNAPNNLLKDISGILALNSLTSAVLTDNPDIPCDQLESLQQKLGQNLIRSPQCRR
ncbi:hypothetical protein [Pseudohongiella spirulinae]|nr:hypothetical protein [Pseudohongiella spirulinae]